MHILLCAKNDLPALVAANILARELAGHRVTIWLSDITRGVERERPDLDLMRFFERELPLQWLLPTVDPCTTGPDTFVSFERLAERLCAPVSIVPRLRSMSSAFRALAPDLVVSIRFSHIFPADFIRVPRHGILNVHPGYLPEFGGLYTPFHQMAAGRTRIGATLHWVDEGIDTGPIVDIASIPVEPERSLQWHVAHTYPAALPALVQTIAALGRGEAVPGTPQDMDKRRYFRLPSQAETTAFQDRFRLVNPADFCDVMARFGVAPQRLALADPHGEPRAAAG